MADVTLMPISQGSSYNVYVPDVGFFANKILNQKFFSYTKLSVEWWMLLIKSLNAHGLKPYDIKNNLDHKLIPSLARGITKAWNHQQRGNRQYKSDNAVIERILRMSASPKPKGFLLGVTDRCHVRDKTFPLPPRGKNMVNLIEGILPKGEIPIHALPVRIWAVDGRINRFLNLVRHKNIVIVGPDHLKNFGRKLNLKNFNFVEIHKSDAIKHVKETKAKIERLHKRFMHGHEDVTYFFIGGGAAMWLITELHGRLQNANLMDIGRAFDVYYFYDPVMRNSPPWMFGQWLNRGNTVWVLNNLVPDNNGVYCVK